MLEIWEAITGLFNLGTLILCFIAWLICQVLYIWWMINRWALIGIILLVFLTLWLGIQ